VVALLNVAEPEAMEVDEDVMNVANVPFVNQEGQDVYFNAQAPQEHGEPSMKVTLAAEPMEINRIDMNAVRRLNNGQLEIHHEFNEESIEVVPAAEPLMEMMTAVHLGVYHQEARNKDITELNALQDTNMEVENVEPAKVLVRDTAVQPITLNGVIQQNRKRKSSGYDMERNPTTILNEPRVQISPTTLLSPNVQYGPSSHSLGSKFEEPIAFLTRSDVIYASTPIIGASRGIPKFPVSPIREAKRRKISWKLGSLSPGNQTEMCQTIYLEENHSFGEISLDIYRPIDEKPGEVSLYLSIYSFSFLYSQAMKKQFGNV
jgi:hypothetical protein